MSEYLAPVTFYPRANKAGQLSLPRAVNGDILLARMDDAVGGGKLVSLHRDDVYLGTCQACPDQCGVQPNADY